MGNTVLNLAEAHDQQSLHLMIMGKEGTEAGASNQVKRDGNVHPYTAADKMYLKPFFDQASGPAWTVLDLRPARRALTSGCLSGVSATRQRILLGYDYLIIIPKTTASRTY